MRAARRRVEALPRSRRHPDRKVGRAVPQGGLSGRYHRWWFLLGLQRGDDWIADLTDVNLQRLEVHAGDDNMAAFREHLSAQTKFAIGWSIRAWARVFGVSPGAEPDVSLMPACTLVALPLKALRRVTHAETHPDTLDDAESKLVRSFVYTGRIAQGCVVWWCVVLRGVCTAGWGGACVRGGGADRHVCATPLLPTMLHTTEPHRTPTLPYTTPHFTKPTRHAITASVWEWSWTGTPESTSPRWSRARR